MFLCTVAGCFLGQGAALGHLWRGAHLRIVRVTRYATEHFSEPGGHEIVEDRVDGGAQVEENTGNNVDMLEDLEVLIGWGVDVAPHQALHVEGGPAEAEHNHQHTWTRWENYMSHSQPHDRHTADTEEKTETMNM